MMVKADISWAIEPFKNMEPDAIRQDFVGDDMDAVRIEIERMFADGYFGLVPARDLIIYYLSHGKYDEAVAFTNQICELLAEQSGGEGLGYTWSVLLRSVVAPAIVLRSWDYFNLFVERDGNDPFSVCLALTLAGRVCLAKDWYDQAVSCFQRAMEWASRDSVIDAETIEAYLHYCEARFAGGAPVELPGLNAEAISAQHHPTFSDIKDAFDRHGMITRESDPNLDQDHGALDEKGEILRRWQILAGRSLNDAAWSEPNDLTYFFQCFRPNGKGLKHVFADVSGGEQMLARILEIYRATSQGYKTGDAIDSHFLVSNPKQVTDKRARKLVDKYLASLAKIGRSMRNRELSLLANIRSINLCRRQEYSQGGSTGIDKAIEQGLSHYFEELQKIETLGFVMREALYTMTGDINLVHYVMFPLVQDRAAHEDPYQHYFELWKSGARLRFDSSSSATLYLPK
jgi:hypothetical protein